MKFLLFATLLSSALLVSCTAQEKSVPGKFTVKPLSGKITIDGKLSEKAWSKGAAVEKFHLYGAVPPNFKGVGTKAVFTYDDRFIYVGVRCEEPAMDKLKLSGKKTDDPVWKDDAVELFFVPSVKTSSYVQIVINADGVVFDLFKKDPGMAVSDLSWNSGAVCKTFKGKDFWSLEAAIPLENLPLQAPEGDWKFHIARNRACKDEAYSCVEGINSFHNTARFFTLSGLKIPSLQLTVEDYDTGEGKYGRNKASVLLKNWSNKPLTASFSTQGAESKVTVAPGSVQNAVLFWEQPFSSSRCDREFIIAEGSKVLRRLTLKKKLQAPFINTRHAVRFLEFNKAVKIPVPLFVASHSLPDLQVKWEVTDLKGKALVSGVTSPRQETALLRVFWSFMTAGSCKLNLTLLYKGKSVAAALRDLRLINSPYQGI